LKYAIDWRVGAHLDVQPRPKWTTRVKSIQADRAKISASPNHSIHCDLLGILLADSKRQDVWTSFMSSGISVAFRGVCENGWG